VNLNSKIEWLDGGATWNPVTGCLHGCPYCYAKRDVNRFAGKNKKTKERIHSLNVPEYKEIEHYDNGCASIMASITPPEIKLRRIAWPFGFEPTFYRYRLDEPQHTKKPQNIFVCSMADLFGNWVPDEWIKEVFKACEKAPQHRYLFLTKNQNRYIELNKKRLLPMRCNFWYGTTTTTEESRYYWSENHNFFISMEPIMSEFTDFYTEVQRFIGAPMYLPWVIVGAETGNRKGKVIPERKWIENIVNQCRRTKTAIFLKDSLAEIWGEPLIQEYPWVKGAKNGN
jgi:protein gp37